MLYILSELEVSINQRLEHLALLRSDQEGFQTVLKEEEKKRQIIKNFRVIKSCYKTRIQTESRCLSILSRIGTRPSRPEIMYDCRTAVYLSLGGFTYLNLPFLSSSYSIISLLRACESMFVNCMNLYLNSEQYPLKSGDPVSLLNAFIYYYRAINAESRCKRMTVIRNCQLFYYTSFIAYNLGFFLENVQASMAFVYEGEKARFYASIKQESRSISPYKRNGGSTQIEYEYESSPMNNPRRRVQSYCHQLVRILGLYNIYIYYYYFSTLDIEKRKKSLLNNFLKRNIHIRRNIEKYIKDYQAFKAKVTVISDSNPSMKAT